ncbi:hypothetical protein HDU67_007667 [Dinochytrium kinnereticum]|nr:hypothetical protein HDU67_007667 [Dinochytrium kinnereticum]
MTVDDFFTHFTGSRGMKDGSTEVVTYQKGPILPKDLDPLLGDAPNPTSMGRTILDFSEKVTADTDWVKDPRRFPNPDGPGGQDRWKVYTYIYDPKPNEKEGWVEIQYWLLYPFNEVFVYKKTSGLIGVFVGLVSAIGSILNNVADQIAWSQAGGHEHVTDLVAVAIRFNKADGKPQRIWYAQHGDGPVYDWEKGADWPVKDKDFPHVGGTHPIVYVSRGNHEHYPATGTNNCPVLYYCSDRTDNDGFVWSPYVNNDRSKFEFAHVRRELGSNADRRAVFEGKNKWMAYNGKIGGYIIPGEDLEKDDTGVNAISFQKNQGRLYFSGDRKNSEMADPNELQAQIQELRSNVEKLLQSNQELDEALKECGSDADFEEAIAENKVAINRRQARIRDLQSQLKSQSEGHYLDRLFKAIRQHSQFTPTVSTMQASIQSITVFCGSGFGNDPIFKAEAEALAKQMVERGIRLVYGGGNKGLMGAVSETVASGGGKVLGVIPQAMTKIEGMFMAGETIFVPDMHSRKATMNKHCDAFIALPGGYGTFEEVLEMITWNQLAIQNKPIVVVNVKGYYDPLKQLIDNGVAEGFIRPQNRDIVVFVPSAAEAIDAVLSYRGSNDRYSISWEEGVDKPLAMQ